MSRHGVVEVLAEDALIVIIEVEVEALEALIPTCQM
jgi:hypothetical protein